MFDEDLNKEPYKNIGIKTLQPFPIKKNIADAQERIKQREAEIFNTSTTLSELDKEIIKHEEEVIRDVTTRLQTHQKMKKMMKQFGKMKPGKMPLGNFAGIS